MKVTLLFLITVVITATALAQPPDTVWTRTYGGNRNDACTAVGETLDGGYILGGSTFSFGAGVSDAYLIRTDAGGDTLWTRTYGGYSMDGCYEVLQTADGGYAFVGDTYSFGGGGLISGWLKRMRTAIVYGAAPTGDGPKTFASLLYRHPMVATCSPAKHGRMGRVIATGGLSRRIPLATLSGAGRTGVRIGMSSPEFKEQMTGVMCSRVGPVRTGQGGGISGWSRQTRMAIVFGVALMGVQVLMDA